MLIIIKKRINLVLKFKIWNLVHKIKSEEDTNLIIIIINIENE